MNPPRIHLADQDFLSKHSEKCNLLIRISGDRLSYAVISNSGNKIKALADRPLESGLPGLKSVLAYDPIVSMPFARVKISVITEKFTFIPAEVYSEGDLAAYAAFTSPGTKSTVLVRNIRSAGIKNVTAVDEDLVDYLLDSFKEPLIVTQANPLIEAALEIYSGTAQNQLFLQFNSGSFEVLLLRDGLTQFYNLYCTETTEEFNYYLLALIKDLGLNYTDTGVIISGDIKYDDETCARLQKYFSAISFADTRRLMRRTELFRLIAPHQYFALLGLNLCE